MTPYDVDLEERFAPQLDISLPGIIDAFTLIQSVALGTQGTIVRNFSHSAAIQSPLNIPDAQGYVEPPIALSNGASGLLSNREYNMQPKKHEQVLANRGNPDIVDHGHAPAIVGETVIFSMKDNCHAFSLDLETILRCLAFAENQGAVPALPDAWWKAVYQRYQL